MQNVKMSECKLEVNEFKKVCGGSGQIIFIRIQTVYLNWDKLIKNRRFLII